MTTENTTHELAIHTTDLNLWYGDFQALYDVNLDIKQGIITSMIGPSGCGKTTLLHVIAGISRPDSGKVRVDDWEITLFSEAESDRFRAERIGYVFQTFNLLSGFSAYENVLISMKFAGRRADRKRAKSLLDRVGLGHRITHKPPMLSVGEQQRVAVARAIAGEPALVLADEPTANLDSTTSQALIEMMRKLNDEQGVTFVFATHDPRVMDAARRVVTLVDGKVAEDLTK